jgi:hypothetical protein
MDLRRTEFEYPLAYARGSVVRPDPKVVPKNKKFQRSTAKSTNRQALPPSGKSYSP